MRCTEYNVDDEFGEMNWQCNRMAGHSGLHKAIDPNAESLQVDGCFVRVPVSERMSIQWAGHQPSCEQCRNAPHGICASCLGYVG